MTTVRLPSSALDRIRLHGQALSPSLRRVAEFVVQHAETVVHQTITELASSVGVGEATITRLCHKLEFAGFHAFKIALASDVAGRGHAHASTGRATGEDAPSFSTRLVRQTTRTLEDTARLSDPVLLDTVARQMARAPRIELTGQGNSGLVAQYFVHRLMRIGLSAATYTDPHLAAVSISTLPRGGVVLALSSSGGTIDTVQHLKLAQAHGHYTVAITHHASSPVTRYASAVLFTAAQEDPLTDKVLDTLTSQTLLLELLYTQLLTHRPESHAMLRVTAESVVDKKY